LNKKVATVLGILVSVMILLSALWYYINVRDVCVQRTWSFIDGKLEVTEVNESADYVVYTVTNLTVIARAEHPEEEKVPLYYDHDYNKYNFEIDWYLHTNTTSHNWSYVDTDNNNLITNGDQFVLYNYSGYSKGDSFFINVLLYLGNIKGEIPPNSEG